MCNGDATYIGKTKGDITHGFTTRMNKHISDCRKGKSKSDFPKHVYRCGTAKNCLIEPYFQIYIMLKLPTNDRLITIEKSLQLKGHDTINRCKITRDGE